MNRGLVIAVTSPQPAFEFHELGILTPAGRKHPDGIEAASKDLTQSTRAGGVRIHAMKRDFAPLPRFVDFIQARAVADGAADLASDDPATRGSHAVEGGLVDADVRRIEALIDLSCRDRAYAPRILSE